jgi:dTDP-L-rhamnose 4-epimerase
VRALGHTDGVRAFNVGSGTPRTVGQMASALAAVCGGPAPVITGRFRLGDVRHITADSMRIRRELGWQPEVRFEEGVAALLRR